MTPSTGAPTPTVDPQAGTDVANKLPRLPRRHLPRTRLWQTLDDAASAITLLVAPVGAGKTLGVAGWLRAGAQHDAVVHGNRCVPVDAHAVASFALHVTPLIADDDRAVPRRARFSAQALRKPLEERPLSSGRCARRRAGNHRRRGRRRRRAAMR